MLICISRKVYDPIFLNDSPENLMSLCPDFRSHRINKIHKIFFHFPLLNIFWRTNNQSVKLWSRWDKIVRDASNKTSSILSDPCELLTKTHRKWKVFPNLHLIEYLEMNCQHLRSNNLLTPMGTVPISVIYGFEYPLIQCKPKSNNNRKLFSGHDNVLQEIVKVGDAIDGNIKMKRKTKGCLTEIKKYRKPNVISSSGNTIYRVNTSGKEDMLILHSLRAEAFLFVAYTYTKSYSSSNNIRYHHKTPGLSCSKSWYKRAR